MFANTLKKMWRSDSGSIDFVQVVVGLMIISIAAIGTLDSLYWGYQHLDQQMRYRKALSIARSYVEYCQGRIHTDLYTQEGDKIRRIDAAFMAGNTAHPEIWLLDSRDPTTEFDDITCRVSHGPVIVVDYPETKGIDHFKFWVKVEWSEPGERSRTPLHKVEFAATMVTATL